MINEKSLLAPDEDIQPVLVMGLFIHEARHIDQYYRRVEFPTVEAKERDANLYFPRLLRDCGGSIPLDRYYDGTQYWDWEDP